MADLDPAAETLRQWKQLHLAFPERGFAGFADLFTDDFCFIDPFARIDGDRAALERYLRKVERLRGACFELGDFATGADGTYVRAVLRFELPGGRRHELPALSHLRFGRGGRIAYQRDYFDAAAALFDPIPGLAFLLRRVRRRVTAA